MVVVVWGAVHPRPLPQTLQQGPEQKNGEPEELLAAADQEGSGATLPLPEVELS